MLYPSPKSSPIGRGKADATVYPISLKIGKVYTTVSSLSLRRGVG